MRALLRLGAQLQIVLRTAVGIHGSQQRDSITVDLSQRVVEPVLDAGRILDAAKKWCTWAKK